MLRGAEPHSLQTLAGLRVAVLVADGVKAVELSEPRHKLEALGAAFVLVSPKGGAVRTWRHGEWAEQAAVDELLELSRADLFGALYLPGGIMCADHLRADAHAIDFVRCFFGAGKPVAATGHAVAILIEADVLAGRTVTSWPAMHTDVQNAGALWVQRAAVRGPGLVTSRMPADLDQFIPEMIDLFVSCHECGTP